MGIKGRVSVIDSKGAGNGPVLRLMLTVADDVLALDIVLDVICVYRILALTR